MRIYTFVVFVALLLFAAAAAPLVAAGPDLSLAPGTVITHMPASAQRYVGSPGIAILSDGAYLAKCDEFGPGTAEHRRARSFVFRSEDRGRTWQPVATIDGLFWANVFEHRGAAYLLGTTKHHGDVVIMRSTDGGRTWTDPKDSKTGLLLVGEYHTAPMPMLVHAGRIWRAVEDASNGKKWGARYSPFVMSAPVDADLLDAAAWSRSNHIRRDPSWLGGKFEAWLEGNAVLTPAGDIVDILRMHHGGEGGKAAVVRISDDGKRAEFDPQRDIVDFPGGAKKFTIRYDEKSKAYWALTNPVMPRHAGKRNAGSIRNTLALMRSTDLVNWEMRCILLYHVDTARHGFQYPDWVFDGDDMIAAIRTAYDDGLGGAHNAHDANMLTFHRFANFRDLKMSDSVIDPAELAGPPKQRVETDELIVTGMRFELGVLSDGELAFGNRQYVWNGVPGAIAGRRYTRTSGGVAAEIRVEARKDTTLLIATAPSQSAPPPGWTPVADGTFDYTDKGRTKMTLFTRSLRAGETLELPQTGWTGCLLILPPR